MQPLYKLISGENSKEKKNEIEWDQDCEITFLLLKRLCTEALILAYTDYTKPFKVHTDASKDGFGAILYQTQDDGTDRVIAYASQSLKKSEQKYHSSKLEYLALKWAITDQFHEYLYGGTFEIHSHICLNHGYIGCHQTEMGSIISQLQFHHHIS